MTADGYALLVVDMQNGFCHPDGSFPRIGRGLEGAMDAVRTAAVAVGQARRAGIPVVFTRHVYRPGLTKAGATRGTSRQPSRNNPRNASATSTNATAVPCPATTRRTMPTATVPSHAPTPAGNSPAGRRQARTASHPHASPARNGHAVDAIPPRLSPRA